MSAKLKPTRRRFLYDANGRSGQVFTFRADLMSMKSALQNEMKIKSASGQTDCASEATSIEKLWATILHSRRELSSLPQTLVEVLRVSRDENAPADAMVDVISRDPGLTARVLRAANSPLFGQSREVKSLRQANQVVGQRAIVACALSASVYMLTAGFPGGLDRKRFWRHSLETAVAARLIAGRVSGLDPDGAFIAGLLHDLGKLILDAAFPEEYLLLLAEVESGRSWLEGEKARWGATHASVGQFTLEQWRLPRDLVYAVGAHHSDLLAMDDSPAAPLARCVALANTLSRHRISGRGNDVMERLERKKSLAAALGLNDDTMLAIEDNMAGEFLRAAEFMEIDIGDTAALLEDANAALFAQYQTVEELLRENKRMQSELAREEAQRETLKSLHAIAGTYNHYLNNATAAIQGQAQLLQLRVEKVGSAALLGESIATITKSVEMISAVLEAMSGLAGLEKSCYHDDVCIFDIEPHLTLRRQELERIKERFTPR